MKTPHLSIRHLVPLAGTIAVLLGYTALAKEARRGPAPTTRTAPPPADITPGANRTPEEATRTGLDYLLHQQQPDGGWGQGGGWRQNLQQSGARVENPKAEDPSDLGNTCVALVALLRAGHSPKAGEHHAEAAKAFEFIARQIEAAEPDSLFVTPVRDTQLQVKIGTYVDTFLAGWALSELKDKMPDDASETRRAAALDKVVRKIEKHQGQDGAFAGNTGWAAVLSQGLASKALNGAARSGARVSPSALEKDAGQNTLGLDRSSGAFTAPATTAAEPSSAGISLYRESSKLGGLWEKTKSNAKPRAEAEKILADKDAPAPAKAEAEVRLKKFAEEEQTARNASAAIVGKALDTRYTAGFGNNGGEEYLSLMNLTESLHAQGGKPWLDWQAQTQKTICGAQNGDGSWAGLHCITGRTFCTSAALLTLLVKDNPPSLSDASVRSTTTTPAEE